MPVGLGTTPAWTPPWRPPCATHWSPCCFRSWSSPRPRAKRTWGRWRPWRYPNTRWTGCFRRRGRRREKNDHAFIADCNSPLKLQSPTQPQSSPASGCLLVSVLLLLLDCLTYNKSLDLHCSILPLVRYQGHQKFKWIVKVYCLYKKFTLQVLKTLIKNTNIIFFFTGFNIFMVCMSNLPQCHIIMLLWACWMV